ncbi:MAG TPA: adenylate/guanylate cyclase domain-containing protein [Solirubrobacteraceae bacterium]|nr:adenylate/guanylate cyclase domain-containing protein [Solirubrobacteraceae bacterium]
MVAARHTFIFTDLVGFTALTAEYGDERAADIAQEFYARTRRLLAEHRAEELKTLGDALMLRCDEPAFAIRLGLRIVGEIERMPGCPAVRVGMHSGTAVSREGDWYGSTVNIAARLCSAAGGGEVLVSEATLEGIGRLRGVMLEDRRLHWLKNVSEPVAAQIAAERRGWFKRRRDVACPHRRSQQGHLLEATA